MLRGVHPLLGPDLLYALQAMGHADEIVLADANFPSSTMGPKVVRADGLGGEALLEAILTHFPLDTFEPPVFRMAVVDAPEKVPDICVSYQKIVNRLAGDFPIEPIERFAFYERSRRAAYIIATGERAIYANLILKKGVVLFDRS